MELDNNFDIKNEEFHIRKIVEDALNQSGITKTKFAKAIGVHLQNLNREFANADWSVMKLKKAGKMLNHDFSWILANEESNLPKTKIKLEIELEEDMLNAILSQFENKKIKNLIQK